MDIPAFEEFALMDWNRIEPLYLDLENQENLPTVNDQAIDLKPERVFDSPYLCSENGSGVVTIEFNKRRLLLDFNSTCIMSEL